MALISSISGIRGTIGGRPGENLTPPDLVAFASAFGTWIRKRGGKSRPRVLIGRDARLSGDMVVRLVGGSLMATGVDVTDYGLVTTPTLEMAVTDEGADGGIILTASHNPGHWNALKLLNSQGEFISGEDGGELLRMVNGQKFEFVGTQDLGRAEHKEGCLDMHIDRILDLDLVDVSAIGSKSFRVVVDGINSVGGIAMPVLLERLGAGEVIRLNCEPTGLFAHDPEPLARNLVDLSELVRQHKADLGLAVDPDVDRLVIMDEHGNTIGEEYTLVAVADYVLGSHPGNTVSNLSSSRALADVTARYGGKYQAAPVGEVNVVEAMKATGAVIGGEGNGGIILPALHYGRDALAGTALFLSHLARSNVSCSALRSTYPDYYISKNKLELKEGQDVDELLENVATAYRDQKVTRSDGVRIDFSDEWVHLRKSNTEPILRIIAESPTMERAEELAGRIMDKISSSG